MNYITLLTHIKLLTKILVFFPFAVPNNLSLLILMQLDFWSKCDSLSYFTLLRVDPWLRVFEGIACASSSKAWINMMIWQYWELGWRHSQNQLINTLRAQLYNQLSNGLYIYKAFTRILAKWLTEAQLYVCHFLWTHVGFCNCYSFFCIT